MPVTGRWGGVMAVSSWFARTCIAAVLVAGLPAVFASPAEAAACRKDYYRAISGDCVRYRDDSDERNWPNWANWGPWGPGANWGYWEPWGPPANWGPFANWGYYDDPLWELDVVFGTSSTATFTSVNRILSGFPLTDDFVAANASNPSGTGFTAGLGASKPCIFAIGGGSCSGNSASAADYWRLVEYAPEANNAYAAAFPIKAPPAARSKPPLVAFGFDSKVYFFAGGDQNISGIPGGPFGTATGQDSFRISNNVLFTVGGLLTVPVTQSLKVSLTGGFAELNQTVKYNCVSFCAVGPAAPAFTASQDKWISGAYVGGRFMTPLNMPGLPAGTSIGLDYKHVFFGSYGVSLGNAGTQRVVNMNLSPDMDLVTARLAVPLGRGGR